MNNLCEYKKRKDGTWKCPVCKDISPYFRNRVCVSKKKQTSDLKKRYTIPCIHKGKSLRLVECNSCCGKVNIFEFSCTLHKVCFIDAPKEVNPDTKRCITCKDYIPTSKETSNV